MRTQNSEVDNQLANHCKGQKTFTCHSSLESSLKGEGEGLGLGMRLYLELFQYYDVIELLGLVYNLPDPVNDVQRSYGENTCLPAIIMLKILLSFKER